MWPVSRAGGGGGGASCWLPGGRQDLVVGLQALFVFTVWAWWRSKVS